MTSVYNITKSPLVIGGQFIGSAESTVQYYSVSVSVVTDSNCLLFTEYSIDGHHWDYSNEFSIAAAIPRSLYEDVKAKFFRLRVLNNSSVAQSYLRVGTVFKSENLNVNLDVSDFITTINPDVVVNEWNNPFDESFNVDKSKLFDVFLNFNVVHSGMIHLLVSPDNVNWSVSDNYAIVNQGDSSVSFIGVASGSKYIKLRADATLNISSVSSQVSLK